MLLFKLLFLYVTKHSEEKLQACNVYKMTGTKVQKDHSSYCPGGDCTCPPITKSKELGIKKLIKAIDKEKQENKAKPENLRKPVHLNIAKAPKKVTPKVIF